MLTDRMSHQELRDLLGVYALGAVDGRERAAVEVHLGECRDCRRAAIVQLESCALLVDEPLRLSPTLWDPMVARVAARRHS